MKFLLLMGVVVAGLASVAVADERIYRCGNEYTNTVSEAQARTCKLISGGNITVIQGQKPNATAARPASNASTGARVDAADQRAKDSDARMILESELKKAEARRLELQQAYNNGEPEKQGAETRNNQKYLDRVQKLQNEVTDREKNVQALKKELGLP